MRRIFFSLILVISLISFVSAGIIINQQPKNLYNFGDVISVPMKIVATQDTHDFFSVRLICSGVETEMHKEYVVLETGEEKQMNISIPLTKKFIGTSAGTCRIKAGFGGDYSLTNEFKISNLINIKLNTEKKEFTPGGDIIIEGEAIKENQEPVRGFIELKINENLSQKIDIIDTVNMGKFSVNFSLPKDTKAGQYLLELNVYEVDLNGDRTNNGFANYNILILQIPTTLEIVLENSEVEPGANLKVKTILHDQTGERITPGTAVITIRNKEKILEQTEKTTDEFLEYPISKTEPPAEWEIIAVSDKLTSRTSFKIKEKKYIKVEIINKTIILTNEGNIPYNDSVLIKIDRESLSINTFLEVNESRKYLLTAPDGSYKIEVIADGENKFSEGGVPLTGDVIGIKEVSGKVFSSMRYLLTWIFIIGILGFVTFIFFKRGYKKSFFGHIPSSDKKKRIKEESSSSLFGKKSIVETKNKAELSLSITGDKQNASIVCVRIKGLKDMHPKSDESVRETLHEITKMAEENKTLVYENQDLLFIILAPVKTKTFANEKTALKIAQKVREVLVHHNKLFKQKMDFGISINYGTLIGKDEKDTGKFKFMSMGNLITTAKKIAVISDQEILLGEKVKERLGAEIKVEKHEDGNLVYYAIKEIRNTEEHKKFLRGFLERIEDRK